MSMPTSTEERPDQPNQPQFTRMRSRGMLLSSLDLPPAAAHLKIPRHPSVDLFANINMDVKQDQMGSSLDLSSAAPHLKIPRHPSVDLFANINVDVNQDQMGSSLDFPPTAPHLKIPRHPSVDLFANINVDVKQDQRDRLHEMCRIARRRSLSISPDRTQEMLRKRKLCVK